MTGLDRQRADAAGQQVTPVPGFSSTTAAGLARRLTPGQWLAVEAGLAAVTGRMLALLPVPRAAALTGGQVTIDLDTTDVEVYGRKKRGVAYNYQGQRVGRPQVASWAETEIPLAADLGDGTDDPRATAPGLLRRALAALPERARTGGRVAMRADAGYFAGQLARAAHEALPPVLIHRLTSPVPAKPPQPANPALTPGPSTCPAAENTYTKITTDGSRSTPRTTRGIGSDPARCPYRHHYRISETSTPVINRLGATKPRDRSMTMHRMLPVNARP